MNCASVMKLKAERENRMSDKSAKTRKHGKKASLWRVFVVIFFIVLFSVVGAKLYEQQQVRERVNNRQEELKQEEAAASAEREEVVEMSRRIGTDDYIEEVARDELGMVMPGETVFETEK